MAAEKHAIEEQKPEITPLIMSMDQGIDPDDVETFCAMLRRFAVTAKEQYPNQKVELWLLPTDMVNIFLEAQKNAD